VDRACFDVCPPATITPASFVARCGGDGREGNFGAVARFQIARRAGRLARAAKQSAAALKAEYESGKRGDESPVAPIWPTPKEQLDAVVALLPSARSASAPSAEELDADAGEVAQALRGVDWAGVRAATAQRTNDATRAMRSMAGQVDWAKVQPIAAHVSSALIAAVATGQIGVGGRLGSTVVRAIADQAGLAERVAQKFGTEEAPLPPDFRHAIDVTAEEA
jgi:hypothetical protein